jgi:hypothetical protein
MNVFQFLKYTDEIILRTYQVQNDTGTTFGVPRSTSQWVCFTRTDDSFESELSEHLPPSVELSVQLQDVIYDPLLHSDLWKEAPRRLSAGQWRAALYQARASLADREAVASLLGEGFLPEGGGLLPTPLRDVPGVRYEPGDVVTRVTFIGRPPPERGIRSSCQAVGVSEMNLQILSGLRSVLVTLLDAGGRLCLDKDFLGLAPATDVFAAMDLMSLWSLEDFVPNEK